MEEVEGTGRTIARTTEDATFLGGVGYFTRKLFYTQAEAEEWVKEAERDALRERKPARHQTRIGPDPSTTPKDVFGVNMDLFDQTDEMCLPVGTPSSKADEIYDCATDVMALPGGYKHNGNDEDDEDQGDLAAAFMTMAMGKRETGIHMRYHSKSNNGIRRIKERGDLPDFLEAVHEGWQHAQVTMTSQFTRKMHRAGHTSAAIEDYLQNGVLVRVVNDTYTGYAHFLTTLSMYVNTMDSGEGWKESVAYNLLKMHERELELIRTSSASYRELVLRNYTYIRDASKVSFWNNKLSKKMALITAASLASYATQAHHRQGRPTPAGVGNTGGSPAPSGNCTTCNRVHQGRPCAAAPFSAANRTRLGAGLRQRQYEKALKYCKEAFSSNPNVAHDEVIEAARLAANA
jgi:hypothetical protein